MRIRIPNEWSPRPYQIPLWSYLENGGKRAAVVWHRRSGKDSTSLNWTATDAIQNIGTYWHMLPEARQARKVVWDAIDKHGRRVIDQAFPPEIRDGKANDVEMRIRLKNGSVWQCVGSDNYNSLVGANPRGVVFSEFSIAKPAAWDFVRPILAENGGWALFIYTPRGENHGYELYEIAKSNPDWFAQILTVDDTKAIPLSVIDDERKSGMPEEMVQQEYFCSFTASLVGSYYGHFVNDAIHQGRVTDVQYDDQLKVHTIWDLGIGDSTSIIFAQFAADEIRVIDYYENHGQSLEHYAAVLASKDYNYADDWVPHDAKVRELGTGRTRVETLGKLGRKPRLVPDGKLEDGINAARVIFPKVWFDAINAKPLIKALKHYQKEWDDERRCYKDKPLHDWSSHPSDAFRYLAMAYRELKPEKPGEEGKTIQNITMNELWKAQRPARQRI